MRVLIVLLLLGSCFCVRADAQFCHLSLAPVHFGTVNIATSTPSAIATATINCAPQAGDMYACLAFGQDGKTLVRAANASQTLPFDFTSGGAMLGDGKVAPMLGPFQPSAQGITVNFGVELADVSATMPAGIYNNDGANFMAVLYERKVGLSLLSHPPSCTQIMASGVPPVRAPLLISATIPPVCAVNTTSMMFGQVGLLNQPLKARATIEVHCNTASEVIALDNGQTGSGPTTRFMMSGNKSVEYGIYQNAADTRPWGSLAGATQTASGDATLTAYGLVPVQKTPQPGLYTDVVNVTVTY